MKPHPKVLAIKRAVRREGRTGWLYARVEELRPCLAWKVWNLAENKMPSKSASLYEITVRTASQRVFPTKQALRCGGSSRQRRAS